MRSPLYVGSTTVRSILTDLCIVSRAEFPSFPLLQVVTGMAEGSVMMLGIHQSDWGMNSTQYAAHIARSRCDCCCCCCSSVDVKNTRV